ncbi:cell division protein DivIVA [Arthrobacter sp. YC-RL1]|uniref:DivIVA domain-containing protein n=1 Tax=Arthrobacter sp. YC-RL1 TaxID=1652545 RepID=UPI00063D91F6|nr:DivIVA domain-containing protein [Arthrobacter sp. YC-RL1]ALQ30306.1 cell division protein DivIVA [Arthrobacter sp. YC-RL1]KLI88382.1 cell division protein DivIVA [Arthrobacter sp. YC-RL1]
MPFVLVFLALLLVGGTALLLSGRRRAADAGRHFEAVPEPIAGLAEPEASLPPVLLPEHPRASDIDKVRFSLGLRGYRCDQVDDTLDVLAAEITRLENVIRDIESRRVISDTAENSQ